MELKIKSIHFDATEKLHDFIAKKLAKLEKSCDQIGTAEVTLKVVKPETAKNKETGIRISVPNDSLFAEKVCDTFEEGTDLCVDSMKVQLVKFKEKLRNN